MSDESEMPELRLCNECGEKWIDGGSLECPHCGSDDTEGGHFDDDDDDEKDDS